MLGPNYMISLETLALLNFFNIDTEGSKYMCILMSILNKQNN